MANYYGPDSINRTGNESAYCSEDECCNEDEQQYGAGTSRCSTSTPLSPASCCWQESGQESTLLPSREIEVEVAIIGKEMVLLLHAPTTTCGSVLYYRIDLFTKRCVLLRGDVIEGSTVYIEKVISGSFLFSRQWSFSYLPFSPSIRLQALF